MKEFGVVKNMFKQNIKRKKSNKNKLMRYRRKKTKCAFMLKRMGFAQGRKNAKSKYTHKIHRITKY